MATKSVATEPKRRRQYVPQARTLCPSEFHKFNALEGRKLHEVFRCDACDQPLMYSEGCHGEYEFTFGSLPYHVHRACFAALDNLEARRELMLTRTGLHSPFWRNAVEIMLATLGY